MGNKKGKREYNFLCLVWEKFGQKRVWEYFLLVPTKLFPSKTKRKHGRKCARQTITILFLICLPSNATTCKFCRARANTNLPNQSFNHNHNITNPSQSRTIKGLSAFWISCTIENTIGSCGISSNIIFFVIFHAVFVSLGKEMVFN